MLQIQNDTVRNHMKHFESAVGASAGKMAENLLNAFDEDVIFEKAQNDNQIEEPDEEHLMQAKTQLVQVAVALFHNPDARDYIENVRRSHDQIADNVNLDGVLFAGYDAQQEENAECMIVISQEFIEENSDEILALRIIYNENI